MLIINGNKITDECRQTKADAQIIWSIMHVQLYFNQLIKIIILYICTRDEITWIIGNSRSNSEEIYIYIPSIFFSFISKWRGTEIYAKYIRYAWQENLTWRGTEIYAKYKWYAWQENGYCGCRIVLLHLEQTQPDDMAFWKLSKQPTWNLSEHS